MALSGWFVDAAGWGCFQDLINTEQQSWAFVNYRGYGDRKDLDGPYTNAQIAADVLEVADRLEWDDFALVGHSLGGKAIQRVYADAPQRVTALIGISPIHASAFPFDDEGWKLFEDAVDSEENRYDHRLHHRQGTAPPGSTRWSAIRCPARPERRSALT